MSGPVAVTAAPAQTTPPAAPRWRLGYRGIAVLLAALVLIALTFGDGIRELVRLWGAKEEYSHAYLIPFISLFLAWQKTPALRAEPWPGSWSGVVLVAAGIALYVVGALSTIYAVMHYALIVTLAGSVLAYTGTRSFRYLWVAVVFLLFMVPLPQFLYQAVSTKLQLLSSEFGVWVIRLFDISVYLEGNVIDLGDYKLQVVEACNGLRYLFPLASFGFLCAYLYRGPWVHKLVLFVSTVPITVIMNSVRIGAIGVTVNRWGPAAAEGFLHDFEGWSLFMVCLGLLFVEIVILARCQRPAQRFAEVFYLEIPASPAAGAAARDRIVPAPFLVVIGLLVLSLVISVSVPERREQVPRRESFAGFPMTVGAWSGVPGRLDRVYLEALKLTDYVLADYRRGGGVPVNLYVAYYASQRAGESAHSPRSCIPGGGWKITGLARMPVITGRSGEAPRFINRVQIEMGDQRQLVYYWFQQRGRLLANEYLVKWFLLWDAMVRNRSDGALVRLTTPLARGEDWAAADGRLREFTDALPDRLARYVPD